jgi:RPAP1-like, N-terminal
MATMAGDRFVLDLSDDDGDSGARQKRVLTTDASTPSPEALIGDIREHSPTAPPAAPQLKSSTGFPKHQKRSGQSRFKQRRTNELTSTNANSSQTIKPSSGSRSPQAGDLSPKPSQASFEEQQRQEIDAENRRRLAGMSPEEIEKEQSELMAGLSP